MVEPAAVYAAAAALAGVVVRTPLRHVPALDAYLKLENLQVGGSFKIRGAYYAVCGLPDADRRRGVITYSSGNHGQALAYAACRLGVRAVVVMPETAPAIKVAGVRRWGGEVVLAGRTSEDRQNRAEAIAAHDGLAIVSPFDNADIVAGQATVALEIQEALPSVASVVVPVGGGGLIAGILTGLGTSGSQAQVWGVEPAGAPKLTRALAAGAPTRLERSASIADGLVPLRIGAVPWAELVRDRGRLAGVAVVEDDSLREAVHYLWRECRLAVEPSGAAAVAALRAGALRPAGPVVLVISGGNVDPSFLEDC